jgi:hypothetical protein
MHTYAIAMVAWMSEIEKALNAPVGNPSGLVARRILALTADRLGCEGVLPIEWMPLHAAYDLRDDIIFEA